MSRTIINVLEELGLAVDLSLLKDVRGVFISGKTVFCRQGPLVVPGAVFYKCSVICENLVDALLIDCTSELKLPEDLHPLCKDMQISLSEVDFLGANLQDVDLAHANLQGADLKDVNLQGVNLYATKLQDANLQAANLQGAILKAATLRNANLEGANLQDSDIRQVFLNNANLQGADLYDANLQGANLQGANLQGANLKGTKIQVANLQDTTLDECHLQNAKLKSTNLSRSSLKSANVIMCTFEVCDFTDANLRSAKLSYVVLKSSSFVSAILCGILLEFSHINSSSFYVRDNSDAIFKHVVFENVRFKDGFFASKTPMSGNLPVFEACTFKDCVFDNVFLGGIDLSSCTFEFSNTDSMSSAFNNVSYNSVTKGLPEDLKPLMLLTNMNVSKETDIVWDV